MRILAASLALSLIAASAAIAEPKVVHVQIETTPRTGTVQLREGSVEIPVVVGMPSFCTSPINPVCTRGIQPHVVRQVTVVESGSVATVYDAGNLPAALRNDK